MISLLRAVKRGVVETLYPKVCAGCGQRGTWLCQRCERTVPRLDVHICNRCGAPWQSPCISCTELDPLIQRARSSYPYVGWVSEAVRRFKYHDEFARCDDLGARLVSTLAQFDHIDALVPVPLHRSRLRSRGYNQSELLAQRASDMLGVPVEPLLRRCRFTAPQVSLEGSDRLTNVENAFEISPDWVVSRDRAYMLIDDVRTTGATLNACARALSNDAGPTILAATFSLDVQKAELDRWVFHLRDDHAIR